MRIVGAALGRASSGPKKSQRTSRRPSGLLRLGGSLILVLLSCGAGIASTVCTSERAKPLQPTDRTLCAELAQAVRNPRALPLDAYQAKLAQFLRNFCHRDEASGWKRDKHVRDTGPYIGTLKDGQMDRHLFRHARAGRHLVLARYVCVAEGQPDGRALAHESHRPFPTARSWSRRCSRRRRRPAPLSIRLHLAPTSGAAVMVRDAGGSYDGWFWGWFGWGENDWRPDWPAPAANDYPYMGYGLYCTNCHASARDNPPSRHCATSRASAASRWCFSARHSSPRRYLRAFTRRLRSRSPRPKHRRSRPTLRSSRASSGS